MTTVMMHAPSRRLARRTWLSLSPPRLLLGARSYNPQVTSRTRERLAECQEHLVGVGRLATMMPDAYFPSPKPFGFHINLGAREQPCFKNTEWSLVDVYDGGAMVEDTCAAHCEFAVLNEFPWFPLLDGLGSAPTVQQTLAETIVRNVDSTAMARRWWFAYEMFVGMLPVEDMPTVSTIPFLPPERFFCTSGHISQRHGVLDNLLGNREFCPFVEKVSGIGEAADKWQAGLNEALAPVCMMTIKDVFAAAKLEPYKHMNGQEFQLLVSWLDNDGFPMSEQETSELSVALGIDQDERNHAAAADLALLVRGSTKLAVRLRQHLLTMVPADPEWRAPGEAFLERLAHVTAAIETRTSQMIEGALPPERGDRFYVDVLSDPRARGAGVNLELLHRLQRGVLPRGEFDNLKGHQVEGQPFRVVQNYVSTTRNDGDGQVFHLELLPPPPDVLRRLLEGYCSCIQRMMSDPTVDHIVCATIAKVTFNALHPMADGNGRVQRALFQLVLLERGFLPNVNIPISVIIVQDRKAYEKLQGLHCKQIMAGVAHMEMTPGNEDYEHVNPTEGVATLYRFQDATFAHCAMLGIMDAALPVLAAKAYFLQRFDHRVDELLKLDPLLPVKAATKIAKAFKNDKKGLSMLPIVRLILTDGWWIGLFRIKRLLSVIKGPDDKFTFSAMQIIDVLYEVLANSLQRLRASFTSQVVASTYNITVGISRANFEGSSVALQKALKRAQPGDTVTAVYFPSDPYADFDWGPGQSRATSLADSLATQVFSRVQEVVEGRIKPGVIFKTFAGERTSDPLRCFISYLTKTKAADVYIGFNAPVEKANEDFKFTFAAKVVERAPCNVVVVRRGDVVENRTIWVGISARNMQGSLAALKTALARARQGDKVVAVRFPANTSGMYMEEMSPMLQEDWQQFMGTVKRELSSKIEEFAKAHTKKGVGFEMIVAEASLEPRAAFCKAVLEKNPDAVYMGYCDSVGRRAYRFVGYILDNTTCDLVIIKSQD